MKIGSLNKQVTIQYATQVSDDMGSFTETWNDADTVWAAIWPTSAREVIQSMQTDMVITHRIRIRYRSVLWPSFRIKFGNRYFNVVSVINQNEANRWLDLMCLEVV